MVFETLQSQSQQHCPKPPRCLKHRREPEELNSLVLETPRSQVLHVAVNNYTKKAFNQLKLYVPKLVCFLLFTFFSKIKKRLTPLCLNCRRVENLEFSIRITSRNRNHSRKHFSMSMKGPDRFDYKRKQRSKIS